ncbi:hypothetical protein [Haloarcula litorea]|uniref:hypothetical protein n=1 Tax=Haloarcula litorea TaxID=3032579 RepID=UPI0023E8F385|nr:hypothetical protein [Halomicroarcula sp. GDY20]
MFLEPLDRITNGGRYSDDDLDLLSLGANDLNIQIHARDDGTTVKIDTRDGQTVEIEARGGHLQTVDN